ncbi:MAG: ATP-grasp domain-containing protein [Bacillaceae bacterium]|nr:ATP-grasp domain-containing protein [Bacillaceae bacterium]
MKLVSFNPLRSRGIKGMTYVKPEMVFRERETVRQADWILFPETWMVNFLSYGWNKRIFPSISSYHLGYSKVEMTRAFEAVCPDHVPYTRICASTSANQQQILEEFTFPFVAKDIRNSMGKGVFLIESEKDLKAYAKQHDVLYVQEFLEMDRDIRVVWVGHEVIAAYWRIGSQLGNFRNNVAQGAHVSFEPVPRSVIQLVEETARTLGIDYAGFDVALVQDHPYLLEFNLWFGETALKELNIPIHQKILTYLESFHNPITPTPPFYKVS